MESLVPHSSEILRSFGRRHFLVKVKIDGTATPPRNLQRTLEVQKPIRNNGFFPKDYYFFLVGDFESSLIFGPIIFIVFDFQGRYQEWWCFKRFKKYFLLNMTVLGINVKFRRSYDCEGFTSQILRYAVEETHTVVGGGFNPVEKY